MKTILLSLCLGVSAVIIKGQVGGTYNLSHNVIAGGGSRSVGAQFTVEGTAGQNLAGVLSGGGMYSVRGGFWAFEAFAPTAAGVSISGRVLTANGAGIRSVSLFLTNATTGETRHALSSSFGYYRFDEIAVGQTYILTVHSKRFAFEPNTIVIKVTSELTDVDFHALVAES